MDTTLTRAKIGVFVFVKLKPFLANFVGLISDRKYSSVHIILYILYT